jgi:hypothetical protein
VTGHAVVSGRQHEQWDRNDGDDGKNRCSSALIHHQRTPTLEFWHRLDSFDRRLARALETGRPPRGNLGTPPPVRSRSANSAIKEAKMQLLRSLGILALVGAVTACGNNPTDRALTGGAIGAAGGAVVGSTVGHPIGGAVVGGLGGAAIGAATTPRPDYYYGY